MANVLAGMKKEASMRYEIIGTRYGGEHTIGTIPKEVAKFWFTQGNRFKEYMKDTSIQEERNKDGSVPKEYQLGECWVNDDVFHNDTLEFSGENKLQVLDTESNDWIAEIKLTDVLVNKKKNPVRDRDWDRTLNYLVYRQGMDKGGWTWILETDEVFDVSKLKVNIDQYYDDIKLVDTLVYDGQEIESDGGDGNIHHDFYCWINCGTRA